MYTRKKSAKKHFMPVRSGKVRARKIKKTIIIIAVILLIVLAFFGLKKLSAVLFALNGPSWAKWQLEKITITGESDDTAYEVIKHIGFEEGDTITRRDAKNLEAMLSSNLRQIEKIKIKRKFLKGELLIKIKKHHPLARIISGDKTFYLAPNGVLFIDLEQAGNKALLDIHLNGKIISDFLPQELVKLIQALNAFEGIAIEGVIIDTENKSFTLNLADAKAQMGGYGAAPDKLKRLAAVLGKAAAMDIKKPYTINLNYFNDGKIYLYTS